MKKTIIFSVFACFLFVLGCNNMDSSEDKVIDPDGGILTIEEATAALNQENDSMRAILEERKKK